LTQDFLQYDGIKDLEAVEKICLGLIGISAGSELQLKDLRQVGKQVRMTFVLSFAR
jgi:hypothetical protein